MVFVFAFLGEFGYELLNWQARIRKFARSLPSSDAIVCCSRAGLAPLYEAAHLYLDISRVPLFRYSQSRCYSAVIPRAGSPGRRHNRVFDAALRRQVRGVVRRRIAELRPPWADNVPLVFVFSSSRSAHRGFTFGCDPDRLEADGDIFEELDLDGNLFARIEPDLRLRGDIEQRLGFRLSEPYVLVQTRSRRVGPQSAAVPTRMLIEALAKRMRVVLLSFETGRALDSVSRFDPSLPATHLRARSLEEQGCLIHHAHRCVFVTEGDFGSHIYLPPLMGKDVTVIAPRAVYDMGTGPADFYNRHVFRFGGYVVPRTSEEVLASPAAADALVDEIVRSRSESGRHL